MTDEEIEKALLAADDIAISEDVDCSDVLDYINRLKVELQHAESHIDGYVENWNKAEERIRKETAKEIFAQVLEDYKGVDYYDFLFDGIQSLADDYGIKVIRNGKSITVEVDE